MNKKRPIKKVIKVFLFIIILGIILYILSIIKVKSIFIHNSTFLTDQEIIDKTSLKDYPSFFLTSSKSIKSELNEPFIKDVRIERKFYLELHVYIDEYRPLFIKNENNKIILNNKEEIDNINNITLPILINYVPSNKYDIFIEKFNEVDDIILEKISEIKYDPSKYDDERFLLYMNDKNYVYITLKKIDLLCKYNELVTKLDGKKGILYLDSGNYFEIKEN